MKNNKGFDKFMRDQVWVGVSIHFSWGLIVPIALMLRADLWSLTAFVIASNALDSAPMFSGYLRKYKLGHLYQAGNIWTGLVLFGLALGWYNSDVWIFTVLQAFGAVMMKVWHTEQKIKMTSYMVQTYGRDLYEEYRRYKESRKALGLILGGVIVSIIDQYSDLNEAMLIALIIGVMVLIVKVYHYKVYFREL